MSPSHSLWGNVFKARRENGCDALTLLGQIPLFATLRRSELRDIERLVHRRLFADGEVVFWEGEPGVGMYIVQQGEVGIYKEYGKHGQKELARLRPGDFFGEMALIDGEARSADARAHGGPLTVLALDQATIQEMLSLDPQASLEFLRLLCRLLAKRLREIDEKVIGWRILAGQGQPGLSA
jgi:CRP-like cAMP-binding protein